MVNNKHVNIIYLSKYIVNIVYLSEYIVNK